MPPRLPRLLDPHDRKLAASFGAIVLLLMLTVSAIAGYLFTQLNLKEENRLTGTIATILAESIAKVTFSGKYHARLFVEEMQARVPELVFISVETTEGHILAHSQPEKNDEQMQGEDAASRAKSLQQGGITSTEHIHDGKMTREVLLPYRNGFNNEVMGVVRVGIKMEEVHKEQRKTFFTIIVLVTGLTITAIWGILILSHYFGSEHRTLAAQLQGILNHAPVAISITNQAGRILASSKQFERLFGHPTGEQTKSQLLTEHLSAANVQTLAELDSNIFSTGKQSEQELELTLQGRSCTWHISKFPIAHDDKGKTTLICSFTHDITERKLTEKHIIEAKEQWEATFDTIDDIVTIHDRDMRIIRANKAAGNLFQVPPAELIGKHCYEIFRNASEPCADCPEILAQQDLVKHRVNICHQNLGKTFEATSFPIVDHTGLVGFVHIAKDITKELRIVEQLKQAQKMEAIGTLAGGIAHDFNNILTPILGYTEIALTKIAPDNSLTADLQQINTAAGRAKNLVQQILAFSRQGAKEKTLLQPHLVVKEALKLLRSTLPATIEFKTEIASDCGAILADPTQLHQIIMNLCTNAYHAMETTGGILGVSLSHATIDEADNKAAGSELLPGDYILLTVSDTGCGMEHKTLERIFEPYFTTKSNGKGTGLGLSMVHGIVKSYQGHITVDSEPGKGTNFHVYLPRVAAESFLGETTLASPLPTGTGQVLVVDDEEIITGMLKAILTGLGYQTTISNNSLEALTLIKDNPAAFELLITDMTMPHLTGLELAQKTLAIRPELPIILCTGFSELINKEQAHAIGIQAYLMKPISVRELAITAHQLLAAGSHLDKWRKS